MEELIHLDQEFFLYLNNLGSQRWDSLWVIISDKWMAIPFYALLLFLLFKTFGWKYSAITLVFIALLITCTDQMANAFKHGIERLRPCRQEGVMEYARIVASRCGSYGFYSGHASNSMGITLFLGLLFRKKYPKLLYLLIFWAIAVAYSRVYLGVHYPGDIIVGMFFGAFYGIVWYFIHQFVMRKINL